MQNGKRTRIIIDVNVWISYLISAPFRKRLDKIIEADFVLLFSNELLNELKETVTRPKFFRYFAQKDIDILIQTISCKSITLDPITVVELCRDPKDNFLLALAKDGNADYLITGDDDLLTLKNFGKTKIVKITEFEQSV